MRRSPSPRCAELALAALLFGAPVAACPCGAPSGAFPAWTALDERLTVTALAGYAGEVGSFDDRARAWPLPRDVAAHRVSLDLLAAWRPVAAVELSLGVAAAWSRASQPGVLAEGISLGDSAFRARWELPRSPSAGVPAAALWLGARAPTGERDPRANGLTSVGLGHWEASLGGELSWSFGARWTLSVGVELGARAPAVWNDVEVTPGPRGAALLLAVWRPSERVALSAGVTAWLELSPWVQGVREDPSVSHRVGPTLGVSWQALPALRVLASAGVDPLLDGFGGNATASVRATLGLSWAALRD